METTFQTLNVEELSELVGGSVAYDAGYWAGRGVNLVTTIISIAGRFA